MRLERDTGRNGWSRREGRPTRRSGPWAAMMLAGLVAGGCQQKTSESTSTPPSGTGATGPQSAEVAQEITKTATVESIDKVARVIGLKGQDGNSVIIVAGPE